MPAFTTEQLTLAFAYHMVQRLIGADDAIHASELRFLESTFPAETMSASGFTKEDGTFTDRYRSALDAALIELPSMLTRSAKLSLLDTLFNASLADNNFDHTEGDVLVQCSHLLGLNASDLDSHLDSHSEVGNLDLPEPEK